jgi:hypothetical protein
MPADTHEGIREKKLNRKPGRTETYLTKVFYKDGSVVHVKIKVLQTPENVVGSIDRRTEDRTIGTVIDSGVG